MLDVQRQSVVEEIGPAPEPILATRPRRVMDSTEFGPVPEPANLEQARVATLVAEVNRLHRQGGIQTARAIGQFLIESCFGGDASRIHDKSRHPNSFRELTKRDELTVSASFLFYAVAVTEQMSRLPSDVADALSFTSQRVLLGVSDTDEKVELARRSLDHGWTSRELQDEVRAAKQENGLSSKAGRPKTPDFVRAFRLLDEAVALLANEDQWPSETHRFKYYESSRVVETGAGRLTTLLEKVERLRSVLQESGDDSE